MNESKPLTLEDIRNTLKQMRDTPRQPEPTWEQIYGEWLGGVLRRTEKRLLIEKPDDDSA
jgi:hypothetical protein